MEPVLDPLEAVKPSAPLIHPDVMNYEGLMAPLESPTNTFVYLSWGKGDIEQGFGESDVIVENTFYTQPVHQGYIEPHSCLVSVKDAGTAEIWSCSKTPFALRQQIAKALKVPFESLMVHPCYIGGDFGGKGDFMDVAVAYVLSRKSGRPVKMVMDYDEELMAGQPAPRLHHQGAHRGEAGRPDHGAPSRFHLRQRRLRRLQAHRLSLRRPGGRRRVQHAAPPERGAGGVHQQDPVRTHARAGRPAGLLRHREPDGRGGKGAGHGPGGVPEEST